MNLGSLVLRNTFYFRRTNLAVLVGIAVATAVLTGALLVGDSVRGSLRRLALDRLGPYEALLASDKFFRQALADEWQQRASQYEQAVSIEPAIILPSAAVELRRNTDVRRATQVAVLGIRPTFWLDTDGLTVPELKPDQVILNQQLADELGASVGDQIVLRLPSASAIPADSTLAQKRNRVESLPMLRVAAIVPNRGLGRFSFAQNQALPRNVFIALPALQEALEVPGEVNALLVARHQPIDEPQALESHAQRYNDWLQPRLADFGLRLDRVRRVFSAGGKDEVVYDWFQLTSRRMLLEPAVSNALADVVRKYDGWEVMTYLADSIRRDPPAENGAREVPYSLVSGVPHTPAFPLLPDGSPLADQDIVLNQWTADRLGAKPGDTIVLEFFEPESSHGTPELRSERFTVRAVVPLTEPAQPYRRERPAVYREPPGLYNDPDLTPIVEGITDQESIENWDAPFPFDIRRVTRADDEYWQNHRTTPKAFVSLATAQRLWGSRFGRVTSIRFAGGDEQRREELVRAMEEALGKSDVLASVGLVFRPVRAEILRASSGTTPFDALFLGLSSFLVVSALLLVALLFRLGVELRSSQLGLLGACGWPRGRTARLFLTEGLIVAALGAAVGLVLAVGYSALMIAGLRSPRWWLGAISTPFLELFVTPRSLLIGYVSGLVVCFLVIAFMTRRLYRLPPRRLLSGQLVVAGWIPPKHARWWLWLGWALFVPALGLAGWSTQWEGEAQAGGFVAAGFLLLSAALAWHWWGLQRRSHKEVLTLERLAAGNAARHPTRSSLTIGLMASATFLIVAMGAFRMRPTERATGGFELVGQSSLPLFESLVPKRTAAGGAAAGEKSSLPEVYAFRLKPGDDASCRNLYRVTRPRVLGVPRDLAVRYDRPDAPSFAWASHIGGKATANPWHLLWQDDDADTVPVVLDLNTALYSLHWTGSAGSEHEVEFDGGRRLRFRVVALLNNTLLQGSLFIAEERFKELFPEGSGYQFFLVDTGPADADHWRTLWESRFSDQGLAFRPAERVVQELLAVQNTYLSTFQTLGALGVLLGTLGVAAVQARSVFERRGELALLQAVGFRRRRLSRLVLTENLALLLAGLGTGAASALAAVLPYVVVAGASFPWRDVLLLLGVILASGIASSALCVAVAFPKELLPALRGE